MYDETWLYVSGDHLTPRSTLRSMTFGGAAVLFVLLSFLSPLGQLGADFRPFVNYYPLPSPVTYLPVPLSPESFCTAVVVMAIYTDLLCLMVESLRNIGFAIR